MGRSTSMSLKDLLVRAEEAGCEVVKISNGLIRVTHPKDLLTLVFNLHRSSDANIRLHRMLVRIEKAALAP